MENTTKLIKQQKFRQRGSLTLACCLMLPPIMLLMISLLVGSTNTRQDLDAVRAARQSADCALAAFDRNLYCNFGLFGLTEEEVNRTASDYLLPQNYEQNFQVQKSIYENDLLMGAIARHMSVRATAGLIDEGIDRIRKIKNTVPNNMADSLKSLKDSNLDKADPDIQEDESNEEWFSDYSDYLDEEYRTEYHDSLLGISMVYMPGSDGVGSTESFDPNNVSNLEKLAQGLDTLMFTLPEGFTDQILLTEYSLSYFGSQVNVLKQNGSTRNYRTPDGRLQSKFGESRQYEQEMIATGAEGAKAAKKVNFFLGGSRIIINLAAILTSSTERATYDATAAAITAGVAAVSLGTVVIPPEAISAVLIIGKSVKTGLKEKNKLLQGEEIKLWPTSGTNAFKVNYRDHLRLITLVQPREKLLERIGAAISANYEKDFYTEVSCEVTRAAVSSRYFPRQPFAITIERSYFSREDEDDN